MLFDVVLLKLLRLIAVRLVLVIVVCLLLLVMAVVVVEVLLLLLMKLVVVMIGHSGLIRVRRGGRHTLGARRWIVCRVVLLLIGCCHGCHDCF